MNPQIASNELPALGQFIDGLIANGSTMTADQAFVAFREYQQQLDGLRQQLQPALDELDAGGGEELDLRGIFEKVKQQLADEGTAN